MLRCKACSLHKRVIDYITGHKAQSICAVQLLCSDDCVCQLGNEQQAGNLFRLCGNCGVCSIVKSTRSSLQAGKVSWLQTVQQHSYQRSAAHWSCVCYWTHHLVSQRVRNAHKNLRIGSMHIRTETNSRPTYISSSC